MMAISESDVEASIVMQLDTLGWQCSHHKKHRNVFRQSPRSREEKAKLGRLKPDFVLYGDDDSHHATAIIEAKKPNKPLADALEQAKKYACPLDVPVVVATDGYRLKSWHMKHNTPLFYNDVEIDELFPKTLSLHFVETPIYNSYSGRETIGKKQLIKKFRNANDILRTEGRSAGILRFSEFANLMFLKLMLEGGGGAEICGHTWADIENKRGKSLMAAIRSMLHHLRQKHSKLFEQTKIEAADNMEKLICILSSFQLSSVRDDIKGMAFETFIHSYTQGLKNDLGQYFTPRHIIRLMVDYLRPQLGEKIYDPFCGTGGMLIECFRYIQQHIGNKKGQRRALRKKTIYGQDNNDVARIAMMNMIMFGDGHSNVQKGDSYKNPVNQKYDVVITNIPFSQTTEFEEAYPVPPSGNKNGDSIGVQHCLMSLKNRPNARAAIIVPIGFVYKNELRKEREYITKNFDLERVVELTPKCFNPYTEQQTAILMLKRKGQNKGTVYYRVMNDGFSQDGYRVPMTGHNDMDLVMEGKGGKKVRISEIDGWKYKKISAPLRRGEKRLGELATIRKGDSLSPKTMLNYTIGGKCPIVMVADLAALHIDYHLDEIGANINSTAVAEKTPFLYPPKTIVLPTSGKAVLLNHRALLGQHSYLSGTVTGVMTKGEVHPYYLFYWILRWNAEVATYDLGYPGLSSNRLKDIAIPMLDEKKQEAIIEEITKTVRTHRKHKERHRMVMHDDGRAH